ncbi:MAG TPA: ABC transporter ATP-binding protein [Acetobacteraceae bacterium]|nr:ABC transporter ATP-binding protein [Acetobacteraceae bacterium]
MIEIDGLIKAYGPRRVVDGVSLAIGRGEICVLIGPSGCGKSTTLKMINRLIPITAGTIRVDGQDVTQLPVERLRRGIGYAIQSIGLFPHWSVEDNIATVPRLLRWPEARIRDRVTELLELLRLDPEEYRRKRPQQLSGGQQQRVGVARALAGDPDVLLMDEPFGALDPITRGALQQEVIRIQRATGKTIVFVTHDIDEALRLASTIAIMRDGRLVQHASPVELLERPADDFVRDFIGRSEIGLKLLSVRKVGDRARLNGTAIGEPIDAGATLRDALAQMIAQGTQVLPVRDGDGETGRSLALGDIVT